MQTNSKKIVSRTIKATNRRHIVHTAYTN